MIREPWFWRSNSIAAKGVTAALAPLSIVYDLGQRLRWRLTTPATSTVPVICVGNAGLGGVGKTPFAIMLHKLLHNAGVECQFLTRGYGGAARGPLLVDPATHDVGDVGDEALLLARHSEVWVSANRPSGARAAAQSGAKAIIMDDGFQNPTLNKTVSILLIDASDSGGAGKIFPAGPMREPLSRARARADITVYVGADQQTAERAAKHAGTPFAAWLEPYDTPPPQPVVTFSGIGNPEKFFRSLKTAGFTLKRSISFPDHYRFNPQYLDALRQQSAKLSAPLITTEKDYCRLPDEMREEVLTFPVAMKINNQKDLLQRITSALDANSPAS